MPVIEPLQNRNVATDAFNQSRRVQPRRVAARRNPLTRAQVEYHPQFFTGFQIVDKKKHHPPTTPSHAPFV
jgi:hypothetical protein